MGVRPLSQVRGFAVESTAAGIAKRSFDVAIAALLAPLALIVILPLCLLVMADGGRPLYRHMRVGRGGRLFACHKIRTMRPGAETALQVLLEKDFSSRAQWTDGFKLKDDPRVTRLGRFLRKSSLDELPQIWNVLKGEMSLVGPRPIIVEELDKYGDDVDAYLACVPGISGLWQVSGRNETSYEERVTLDTHYAREWSFLLDLAILARTIPAVLRGRGSF